MEKGALYLIPSPLGDIDFTHIFPVFNSEIINSIDFYIVEDVRTGRRFIKKLGVKKPIDQLTFFELNEHTQAPDLNEYLRCCAEGHHIGLLSDAGAPCIADPGNVVVAKAHQLGITVIPLIGPSSIFMSLMASGFNGQNFAFVGYLPINRDQREARLKTLETLMLKTGQTQIFIETPYRNNHILDSILTVCNSDTRLCIATNLADPHQAILSQSVAKWKKTKIDLYKQPTVFLLGR